ncbi:MAG TPA: hypothetical protein VD978_34180 [Azospirillum sp.]|nr:hypothetical protein [Azospirillum sp.]
MKRTLLLAAAAAALVAAPAYAQTRTDAGKSPDIPHRSSASGLPTESPQVDTLPAPGSPAYSGTTSPQSGMPYDRGSMTRSQPQPVTPGSGSTGNVGAATGSGALVSQDDIASRRGRGQKDLELTQTSLLNEFSAKGFTAVRDFRRSGQNYLATVQDQQGRWMNVELDPKTRSITQVQ